MTVSYVEASHLMTVTHLEPLEADRHWALEPETYEIDNRIQYKYMKTRYKYDTTTNAIQYKYDTQTIYIQYKTIRRGNACAEFFVFACMDPWFEALWLQLWAATWLLEASLASQGSCRNSEAELSWEALCRATPKLESSSYTFRRFSYLCVYLSNRRKL